MVQLKENTLKSDLSLNKTIEAYQELFNSWLLDYVHGLNEANRLTEAYNYSLKLPGKRIRPVLSLMSADLLNVNRDKLRAYSLALELTHTASLIHDDLPCMDDDDLRRGYPTCHKVYGEGLALLAGDALLAMSSAVILESKDYSEHEKIKLALEIANVVHELCLGQVLDLDAASMAHEKAKDEVSQQLIQRHLKKTGALLRSCIVGPAYLTTSEIRRKEFDGLSRFSNNIGMLYQVTDDLLDVSSSTEVLGKPSNSDIKQGTPTFVSVFGEEESRKLAQSYCDQAIKSLEVFGQRANTLKEFCEYVLARSY